MQKKASALEQSIVQGPIFLVHSFFSCLSLLLLDITSGNDGRGSAFASHVFFRILMCIYVIVVALNLSSHSFVTYCGVEIEIHMEME